MNQESRYNSTNKLDKVAIQLFNVVHLLGWV
jgi:hypothetical protein